MNHQKEMLDAICSEKPRTIQLEEYAPWLLIERDIKVHPNVFPIDRDSHSSLVMSKALSGKLGHVLDIGTGTGIQAMIAHYMGASLVDAIDIDYDAILNAQHNVRDLGITVLHSDLFSQVPEKKYDTIVAQLPFTNGWVDHKKAHLLFDNNFGLHERLLKEAPTYLSHSGRILVAGGTLGDESTLCELATKYSYSMQTIVSEIINGNNWKVYELRKA